MSLPVTRSDWIRTDSALGVKPAGLPRLGTVDRFLGIFSLNLDHAPSRCGTLVELDVLVGHGAWAGLRRPSEQRGVELNIRISRTSTPRYGRMSWPIGSAFMTPAARACSASGQGRGGFRRADPCRLLGLGHGRAGLRSGRSHAAARQRVRQSRVFEICRTRQLKGFR